MAIQLYELLGSRTGATGASASSEYKYLLRGSDDDIALKEALLAGSPSTLFSPGTPPRLLKREGVSLDEQLSDGLWEGSAHYKLADDQPPETGDSVFSFDTTGGTLHITQAESTKSVYTANGLLAGDSPFKGAIGATADSVEGVDITVPVYAFAETHYLADSTVTEAYKGKLFKLTGKTNDASFKGCEAGECLFLGASGSKRGQGDWEITFKFGASPNLTIPKIGPILNIPKKGWEYVWVRYHTEVVGTAALKVCSQVPIYAVVDQVYKEGSFSDLGIGA